MRKQKDDLVTSMPQQSKEQEEEVMMLIKINQDLQEKLQEQMKNSGNEQYLQSIISQKDKEIEGLKLDRARMEGQIL